MTTATDIDVAALVGEMEAVPCGHWCHAEDFLFHSDEPASHYGQTWCHCGYVSEVTPLCPGYIRTIASGIMTRCRACSHIGPGKEFVRILGPVSK